MLSNCCSSTLVHMCLWTSSSLSPAVVTLVWLLRGYFCHLRPMSTACSGFPLTENSLGLGLLWCLCGRSWASLRFTFKPLPLWFWTVIIHYSLLMLSGTMAQSFAMYDLSSNMNFCPIMIIHCLTTRLQLPSDTQKRGQSSASMLYMLAAAPSISQILQNIQQIQQDFFELMPK